MMGQIKLAQACGTRNARMPLGPLTGLAGAGGSGAAQRVVRSVLFLLGLAVSAQAAANDACTIDQRVSLAKAGYGKEEIDKLCAESGDKMPASKDAAGSGAAAVSGIELLGKGAIAGSDSVAYEKRRCRVQEEGVLYKKGLIPFEKLEYSTKKKIDREGREIFMTLSLNSGFNTEWCLVMRVDKWKYRDDVAGFIADAEKYEKQYDAALAELARRSVRPE